MDLSSIPESWRRIDHGLYVDETHAMHFFAGEFLRGYQMPDNEHNRNRAEETFKAIVKAQFPSVPIHEVA